MCVEEASRPEEPICTNLCIETSDLSIVFFGGENAFSNRRRILHFNEGEFIFWRYLFLTLWIQYLWWYSSAVVGNSQGSIDGNKVAGELSSADDGANSWTVSFKIDGIFPSFLPSISPNIAIKARNQNVYVCIYLNARWDCFRIVPFIR